MMHTEPKAYITGWAWRTPLGDDVATITQRLLDGQCAAQINPHFDARSYGCPLAAAITSQPQASKHARYLRRMGLFALEVAQQAFADAGLQRTDAQDASGERIGLFFGYGGLRAHWDDLMPAFAHQLMPEGENGAQQIWARGLHLLHPFWMLQHLSNNAHAISAQELGARGDGATYAGANAGAQALQGALRALALGTIDAALVVAYDSLLEPETLLELAHRKALFAGDLAQLAMPYSIHVQGFVPGEAAAALVLQRTPATHKGETQIQAVSSSDGQRQHARLPAGIALARRLLQAGDVIDGAALANLEYDRAEREALFGAATAHPRPAAMTACLANFGQVGAAASLLQAIALSACLQQQRLPPLAQGQQAAPGAMQFADQAQATDCRAAVALSNSAPGLTAAIRVEVTPGVHQ